MHQGGIEPHNLNSTGTRELEWQSGMTESRCLSAVLLMRYAGYFKRRILYLGEI
jgi:hypothetical protein